MQPELRNTAVNQWHHTNVFLGQECEIEEEPPRSLAKSSASIFWKTVA